MLKKSLILSTAIVTTVLSGCALHPPATHEELCNQLQRQAVMYASNRNIEAQYTTHTQQQDFQNKLKAANCGGNVDTSL